MRTLISAKGKFTSPKDIMESVVNKFELFKAVISLITTAITYEDQLIN